MVLLQAATGLPAEEDQRRPEHLAAELHDVAEQVHHRGVGRAQALLDQGDVRAIGSAMGEQLGKGLAGGYILAGLWHIASASGWRRRQPGRLGHRVSRGLHPRPAGQTMDAGAFLVQIERAPTIKNTDFRPLTNSDWLQKNNVFFGVEPSPEDTGIALYRASELLGATVTNSQDEKLASIDDLLLDGHGRAVYAILGAGGFLGIGEDHLAVPFSRLNIMYYPEREEVEATLNTTREKLEASPRMTGRDYDKLRDADYVVQVTRYYVDVDSDDEQP